MKTFELGRGLRSGTKGSIEFPVRGTRKGCILVGLLLAAAVFRNIEGAELRLLWSSAPPLGRPMIQLKAEAGPTYAIERSTNLTDWSPVLSGSITNGTLDLLNIDFSGASSAFYRGRVADTTNASTLVEETVDLMQMASALVTPEAGGACALTNDAGVIITFAVAPLNVAQVVPVVMTLVKELKGLPETEAPPVAVRFQPEGYQFLGSATLDFLFPTNLNELAMSSFGYNDDGSELHLLPDTLETNRVRLNLSHFSTAGTAAWTSAGRTAMRNRKVARPVAAVEHTLGSGIAEERQARREGKPASSTPAENAIAMVEFAWSHFILPHVVDASRDCVQAGDFASAVESMKSYLASNGVEPSPYVNAYVDQLRSAGNAANWVCNCVQEAQTDCTHNKYQWARYKLEKAERMRSLFGLGISDLSGCVSDTTITSLTTLKERAPCDAGWSGTLVVIEYDDAAYDRDDDIGGYHEHWQKNDLYTFNASVVSSERTYYNPDKAQATWKLQVSGTVKASHAMESNKRQGHFCVETTTRKDKGELKSTSVPFNGKILLYFKNDQLDYFDVTYPQVVIDYDYEYRDEYDRSAPVCRLYPAPFQVTEVRSWGFPGIGLSRSTTATSQSIQGDINAVHATISKVIPEVGEYYSGGRIATVKLDVE